MCLARPAILGVPGEVHGSAAICDEQVLNAPSGMMVNNNHQSMMAHAADFGQFTDLFSSLQHPPKTFWPTLRLLFNLQVGPSCLSNEALPPVGQFQVKVPGSHARALTLKQPLSVTRREPLDPSAWLDLVTWFRRMHVEVNRLRGPSKRTAYDGSYATVKAH